MSAVRQAPVACPACGTPGWTELFRWPHSDTDPTGDALWCDICHFHLFRGVIISRGQRLWPDEVESAVAAELRRLERAVPAGFPLHLEPWDQTLRLLVVDTGRSAGGPPQTDPPADL